MNQTLEGYAFWLQSRSSTKVEFATGYTKIHLLPLKILPFMSKLTKIGNECVTKRQRLESEFKGQIVSKFDQGLFDAYKLMYFDRMEIRMEMFWKAMNELCILC